MRKPAVLLFLLPSVLCADEVFIKGAGSISGRVLEQTATQVLVDVGGGTIGIPTAKVARIVKAPTELDEFDARAARLGRWDLEGWRALGRWASSMGLEKQAHQAYEQVLAVTPDDPEALEALGFVLLEDRWVPEAVALRARGFVKYEGEWMLPAEAELRLDAAAQEQAAREAEKQARADELETLKAEVKRQYEAEAAADAEWRAEGAAWFYAHAYGWPIWYEVAPCFAAPCPPAPCFPARNRHGR